MLFSRLWRKLSVEIFNISSNYRFASSKRVMNNPKGIKKGGRVGMDILDFAMQMEKDGEQFYREAAEKASHEGMKCIFNMLADDEAKHYAVLESMKKETPQMADSPVLSMSENIFEQVKEQKEEWLSEDSQLALYEKARDLERKSWTFYQEKGEEATDPSHKELFHRIAREEEQHFLLMDNLIESLLRPQNWVEDGEFYHAEEY
jgi:rubrerythrin